MKRACNWLGLSLGLLVLTNLSAFADSEFSKTIKREFDINATGTVYLSNKYGQTDVKTWDRNRVKISVTILVNTSSESNAQAVFNRIKINFSNAADYVKAETFIEATNSWWPKWSTKADYKINYEVYLPASCNLNVNQRYGNLYTAAIAGKAVLDVRYGNFKADGIGDDSSINLGYGNGTLVKGKDLRLDVSYSNLNIQECANIGLDTRYSNFSIEKMGSLSGETRYNTYNIKNMDGLRLEGQYDNYRIGEAGSVDFNGRYSQIVVSSINKYADLDMQYGSAKIKLAKTCTGANINGAYTDVVVALEPGLSAQIDGTAYYTTIRYPNELEVSSEVKKSTTHYLKGHIGKGGGPVIKAQINYGGLRFE